jgi:hypothetical protein
LEFRSGPVLWRGLSQWSCVAHRDDDGVGRMFNHRYSKARND